MKTQQPLLETSVACNPGSIQCYALRYGILLLSFGMVGSLGGCTSPQNCQPYPNYPSYPGYPTAYTLPSGTTVPTVGAPTVGAPTVGAPTVGVPPVGATMAQPPIMGQPIGGAPAYPAFAPSQPIPPGYTTGPR
jgi:hypothetical protein